MLNVVPPQENNFEINIEFGQGHANDRGRHHERSDAQKYKNQHTMLKLLAPAIQFAQSIGLKS